MSENVLSKSVMIGLGVLALGLLCEGGGTPKEKTAIHPVSPYWKLAWKAEKRNALLQAIVQETKEIDEWEQTRIMKPLMKVNFAGCWQASQDLQLIKKWMSGEDENRIRATAQFFCWPSYPPC